MAIGSLCHQDFDTFVFVGVLPALAGNRVTAVSLMSAGCLQITLSTPSGSIDESIWLDADSLVEAHPPGRCKDRYRVIDK